MATSGSKRRHEFSPSDQHGSRKQRCDTEHREHGDTYISGSTNVHFGDRIYLESKDSSLELEAQRFQDSLLFAHMHERYESLREAADGTYRWILERGPDVDLASRRYQIAPFFHWYRDGTGTFWISGKPGSGKSTLMKYLVEHIMLEPLENISVPSAAFSFFFWIGGSDLQRSKIGCMRSLLWQALQATSTKSLATRVCKSHFPGTWTARLLRVVLAAFLEGLDFPIAIFLDGLDESNDHDDILGFLDIFRSTRRVKLCVSSRPETTLVNSLKSCPSLQLQNLNNKDIQRVIKTTFLNDPRVQALSTNTASNGPQGMLQTLSFQIESKAQGVFLWVVLVIKDLLRGITQEDDLATLYSRLERLPDDINALYQDLLRRAQPDFELYKAESALYLSLMLHRRFPLLEFCFAINEDLRKEYLHPSVLQRDGRPRNALDCEKVIYRISSRTAGLLEVRGRSDFLTPSLFEVSDAFERSSMISKAFYKFRGSYVHFIHRTAHDFLQSTSHGHSLLSESPISGARVERICFETNLIYQAVLPGLLGYRFGSLDAGRVLECEHCTDDVVFDCLRNKGRYVMDALHSAEMLMPDTSNWTVSMRKIHSHRRRFWSFPSSKYATVDMLPVLIRNRRYDMARMWLKRYDCTGDSAYLTILMVGLFFPTDHKHKIQPGFLEIVKELLESGAELGKEIKTPIGETFCPLGATLVGLPAAREMDIESVWRLLQLDSFDLSTQSWPSCADCHEIWDMFIGEDGCDARFEFWGRFGAPAVVRLGMLDAFFSEDRSLFSGICFPDDQIVVIATCPRLGSTQDDLPPLWAISEVDAQRLRCQITDLAKSHCNIEAPGICEIDFHQNPFEPGYLIPEALRIEIEKVCANSPRVSFAAAMKRLEKSPETIQKFYECEVERIAHESEETQSRWRQWYWGDGMPTTSHERV